MQRRFTNTNMHYSQISKYYFLPLLTAMDEKGALEVEG